MTGQDQMSFIPGMKGWFNIKILIKTSYHYLKNWLYERDGKDTGYDPNFVLYMLVNKTEVHSSLTLILKQSIFSTVLHR